jgi:hypothetical protein
LFSNLYHDIYNILNRTELSSLIWAIKLSTAGSESRASLVMYTKYESPTDVNGAGPIRHEYEHIQISSRSSERIFNFCILSGHYSANSSHTSTPEPHLSALESFYVYVFKIFELRREHTIQVTFSMATLVALLRNLINLWGIFQQPETYDVIVIGYVCFFRLAPSLSLHVIRKL